MKTIVQLGRPAVWLASLALMAITAGCEDATPPPVPVQPYVDQGYKPNLSAFMHGTVFERTDAGNTETYPVSGYSLVVNLQDTGDNSGVSTAVRAELIKKMALSGFGQHSDPRFTNLQPEQVLADKRVAVVQVIGLLPVGARRGQQFDIVVRAMPRSRTTSLAHGHLYNTELRNRGLDQPSSGGTILAYADAGDVFVNPVYALNTPSADSTGNSAQMIASLRGGTVLNAGRVTEDRPIFLQMRVPQASISRAIERRVNNRYPSGELDRPAAAAQDEGLINLYVPYSFNGDWQHYLEVVNHLYINDSPDFAAQRTRLLVKEAHRPRAALSEISYCLEGLGPTAVPIYHGLIFDLDPAIAYAAARAAVFNGDADALQALITMANENEHPFQLAAVRALGELPKSPMVDRSLEPLLGSDQALVRIEAYKILSAHADRRIITSDLPNGYKLDIVDCAGPPLVYAARTGTPRLAVFGPTVSLSPPVVFAAMDDRLTISSDDLGEYVTLFYRDPRRLDPVHMRSGLSMAELISRLGGVGPVDQDHVQMSYAEVVAILQGLSGSHVVKGSNAGGALAAAPFVLDQPQELTDAMVTSALNARPQGDPLRVPRPGDKAGDDNSSPPVMGMGDEPGVVPSFGGTGGSAGSSAGSGAASGTGGGASPSPSVPSFGNP
jgi:hypothetical protein